VPVPQTTPFGEDAAEPDPTPTTRDGRGPKGRAAVAERLSLDALIQSARVEATKKGDGGAVGAVLRRLAEAPSGLVPVADLVAEGFPAQAVADAAQGDPADRRKGPRARLGVVADQPLLWLTTSGWQSCGYASRREVNPAAESVEHATAPRRIAAWLNTATEPYAVRVEVATGTATKDLSARATSLAWSRIQGAGDGTGQAGSLTGGLYPDALLVEHWGDARLYAGAWGKSHDHPSDLTEQICALEVELNAKNDGPQRWKVEKWQTALDLGVCHSVVWVVRSRAVADTLKGLGVGDGRQFLVLVPASAVGLDGDEMPDLLADPARWWPLRLPSGGAA
jgi:hypothetical protein